MNRIEAPVRRARRRIILGRFGQALCVTLFAGLVVATLAVAAPALWVMEVDYETWTWAWIGGCTIAALLASVAYAWLTAPSLQSVAAEVDRRFALKERISSSLTLAEKERETDFGIALLADADSKARNLDVAARFQLRPSRLSWLPVSIIPILAIVLLLVEPTHRSSADSTPKPEAVEIKQVQTVAAQLKKRIEQQRRKAEVEGLKEAQAMFEKMESELDKLTAKQSMNRKDAMIAMNDLKKQLEERRQRLGSPDQMRRALSQMKGLESGPGEKIAKSIEKGDFGKARDMAKQLASKMRKGELSEKDRERLKKQIEQMRDALKKAVAEHQQKKSELERKIEQAKREGRSADAAKMQQELNQLQQKDAQMQQMDQMAEAMAQAAKAMQQGDASEAADALQEMADQLDEMQMELSELEDLQSAMDQLAQSKNQMRCSNCDGAGCQACMGGAGFGDGQGDGLGRGSGSGDRPEQEEDTNTYETQVRGEVKRGRAIIAGFADGPNRKGVTREDVKMAVEGSLAEEADPTENQALPRTEREHAQQYFDRLREGR